MRKSVDNIDLCALMDAECSGSDRRRIEAELALSPHCAQRLTAWRRNDAALRFALCAAISDDAGRIAAPAPPAPDPHDAPLRDAAGRRHRGQASSVRAAAIAAFAGGAGAAALALAVLVLSGR